MSESTTTVAGAGAPGYLETTRRIVNEVIAPRAAVVDRDGEFPRAQIDELARNGLLGLTVPPEFGGMGEGLRAASAVVREVAGACSSTAMVLAMHYSGVAAIAAAGHGEPLREVAAGRHLTTLSFSEAGSRSHFWVPMSTSTVNGDGVRLDARKSWVTSAGEADSYVWSSRPLRGDGPMTLWLVPADARGLTVGAPFDGLGLRGNASSPVTADNVSVPSAAMLGEDGGGLDLAMAAVLPMFLVLNASASLGLMRAVTQDTAEHLQKTRLAHLEQSLGQQLVPRSELAQLQISYDRTRSLVDDTIRAVEQQRDDAQLLVLEVKAEAGEAAAASADLALRACGGSAFRKESRVERFFRDSRAARVMAPTTDALRDFVGRALCGLPLLGDVA